MAWRLWIMSGQAQLARCAASLVLTALPKPRLPSENGSVVSHFVLSASSAVPVSRRRHCVTFSSSPRKLLRQLWSDHLQNTILKLKFAVEPRQKGKYQAAWTTATAGTLSKRTAFSVDLAWSFLMTNSCVPIVAPSTRRTLTIHWQIEINSPENGSWSDFLSCPGQCVRPGGKGTSTIPHLRLALRHPDPGMRPRLFLRDRVDISHSHCSPAPWLGWPRVPRVVPN